MDTFTIAAERKLEQAIETVCNSIYKKVDFIRDNSNITSDNLFMYYEGVYPLLEEVLYTLIRINSAIKTAEEKRV